MMISIKGTVKKRLDKPVYDVYTKVMKHYIIFIFLLLFLILLFNIIKEINDDENVKECVVTEILNNNKKNISIEKKEDTSNYDFIKDFVKKGETITSVLEGVGEDNIQQYEKAVRQVFSVREFRDGQPYVIVLDPITRRIQYFEYEVDSHRLLVAEGLENVSARVETVDYTVLLSLLRLVIDGTLFQAVELAREDSLLALKIIEIFGCEVNFLHDLQKEDTLTILVEKKYRNGRYAGYGRILAARLVNAGKLYEAYLFKDGNVPARYYNRKGDNLRRNFLQSPLAVTRVTSSFSKNRLHPILGYSRPHEGVDYGAPTGTPVKAVGDGEIVFQGVSGGYGLQVILRHDGGLESMYSHLSGFARGTKQGKFVRQGQTIGFVGSTGLSTGPHLDFRLRQNGKFINPSTAVNPRNMPVSKNGKKAFLRTVEWEEQFLDGQKPLSEYDPHEIVLESDMKNRKNSP